MYVSQSNSDMHLVDSGDQRFHVWATDISIDPINNDETTLPVKEPVTPVHQAFSPKWKKPAKEKSKPQAPPPTLF
jgi:hypothetical protein